MSELKKRRDRMKSLWKNAEYYLNDVRNLRRIGPGDVTVVGQYEVTHLNKAFVNTLPIVQDPSELVVKGDDEKARKRKDNREAASSDTLPVHDPVLALDDVDQEGDTMAESAASNPSALRVAVTSVTDAADRAELSRLKLVADESVIPDVTTHVVAGHLVKSEKFLMGCALGIWVLRPSFLRESKPGQFAPCEAHEWNFEAAVADLPGGGGTATQLSQTQRWLADAPRQNRVKREAKKGMAFAGWRIMLFSNAKNSSSLVNVVKAGHGQVVESIDQPEAQSLTHVLLVNQEALPDPVRARLIEMNVPACSLDLLFYTLSRPARNPDVRAAQWRVELNKEETQPAPKKSKTS